MRLFMVSRDYPSIEYEVLEFNRDTQKATLRGRLGTYKVDYPMTAEAVRKRKLNYLLERRPDDA